MTSIFVKIINWLIHLWSGFDDDTKKNIKEHLQDILKDMFEKIFEKFYDYYKSKTA